MQRSSSTSTCLSDSMPSTRGAVCWRDTRWEARWRIWLALTGALEVQGVVAIAPGGPFMDNPDDWSDLAQAYSGDNRCECNPDLRNSRYKHPTGRISLSLPRSCKTPGSAAS